MSAEPKKKIIIFEDSSFFIKYFSKLFDPTDYKIQTFQSPEGFLEKIKSFQPDCVITDLEMPIVNGVEVCKGVKNDEVCKHIPIMMLTSSSGDEILISSLNEGADDFVTKDTIPKVILAKVENLIRIKILKDELAQQKENKAMKSVINRFSHEFNNILSILKGNVELIHRDKSIENEKTIKRINNISNNIDRIERLIKKFEKLEKFSEEKYSESSDFLKFG